MHTFATFIASFPEFTGTDEDYVQSKLDEAELQIDTTVWGTKATLGHGYLAAHLLAMSPFGNSAKLVNAAKLAKGDCATTYEWHYRRMIRVVAAGIRST